MAVARKLNTTNDRVKSDVFTPRAAYSSRTQQAPSACTYGPAVNAHQGKCCTNLQTRLMLAQWCAATATLCSENHRMPGCTPVAGSWQECLKYHIDLPSTL